MTQSHVAVTPGHGVLARRDTVVLFDPTGQNKALVAAFTTARDDVAAIRSVKQTVIDREFGVLAFVMISWGFRLEMLAFGDCELRSSAPSAPMLSGAQSGTWVEHHIEPQDFSRHETTSMWCGDRVDPVTNFRRGVTACGGVRVTLKPEQAVAFQDAPRSKTASTAPGSPAGNSTVPTTPAPPANTEPAVCEKGHKNPPNSSACFTCGGMIGADAAWNGTNTSVGAIEFPDGTVVQVDRPVRLGRQPSNPGDGTLPVTIHHDGLARDHVEITIDGWAVVLTDLGSETGTFVFTPGAATPARLRANTPHVLEAGTTVQLGADAVSFVYETHTVEHGSY